MAICITECSFIYRLIAIFAPERQDVVSEIISCRTGTLSCTKLPGQMIESAHALTINRIITYRMT